MDGFDILKEAFKKFAGKLDGEDLSARAVRSVGSGGKALVDKALEEFPQSFVKEVVSDFYSFLSSQEIADGISMTVRSFDEQKVKTLLDDVVTQLKTDEVAQSFAKQIKQTLNQASNDDLENAIDAFLSDRSLTERMVFKTFFDQAKPVLDDMRSADESEIAEKIKELADTIPTDIIAQQVGAITNEITPERITKQAHDFVGTLPSPQAISDIVEGVGKVASEQFDRVSKATRLDDAVKAIDGFASRAIDLVEDTLKNDKTGKGTFDKKGGGSFKL